MRRVLGLVTSLLAIGLVPAVPASAAPAPNQIFPTDLPLPAGFQPEGIAIGAWPTAYLGSRADGRIFQIDLRTGMGHVLSDGPGTPSLGIKVDTAHGRLFVAGGTGGNARVIDMRTGAVLASYQFRTQDTFVNDVVLTSQAVWFTDSAQAVLYKLPLGLHGELPAPNQVVHLPLSGDLQVVPGATNLNGIVTTPDGSALLAGQSNTGKLFRIDPATGVATEVDLAGESLPNNDGQLREGTLLYVVQNRSNQVAKLQLTRDGSKARVLERRTDSGFDVPATVAEFGTRFYLTNARFTTPPTPTTPYNAVAIDRF
ncbi:superoxide dismutase [Amycolatopsis taiwanensis]|uniref:superoxide dismutase n=1 Tax=Amycolatopsis taiwanensis TaxID=342230 RepID=UPI0004830DB3|nr:superoxide dismutase [Amycolatopsis taiwanensis]